MKSRLATMGVILKAVRSERRYAIRMVILVLALFSASFLTARGAPPPLARAPALADSLSSREPRALLSARGAPLLLLAPGPHPQRTGSRLPLARAPALSASGCCRARMRETAAVGGGAPTALRNDSLSSREPRALPRI